MASSSENSSDMALPPKWRTSPVGSTTAILYVRGMIGPVDTAGVLSQVCSLEESTAALCCVTVHDFTEKDDPKLPLICNEARMHESWSGMMVLG